MIRDEIREEQGNSGKWQTEAEHTKWKEEKMLGEYEKWNVSSSPSIYFMALY